MEETKEFLGEESSSGPHKGSKKVAYISAETWSDIFGRDGNCQYISEALFTATIATKDKASIYNAKCVADLKCDDVIKPSTKGAEYVKNAPEDFFGEMSCNHDQINEKFLAHASAAQIKDWGHGLSDQESKCKNLKASSLVSSNIKELQPECFYNIFKSSPSHISVKKLWANLDDNIFSPFQESDLQALLQNKSLTDEDFKNFKLAHRQAFVKTEELCNHLPPSMMHSTFQVNAKCFAKMKPETQSAYIAKVSNCTPDQFSELTKDTEVSKWTSSKQQKGGSRRGLAIILDIKGADKCIRSLGENVDADNSPCHLMNEEQVTKYFNSVFETLPEKCLDAIDWQPSGATKVREILTKPQNKKFIRLLSYDSMMSSLKLDKEETGKDAKAPKVDTAMVDVFLQTSRFCRDIPSDKIDLLAELGAMKNVSPQCVARFSNKDSIVDATWKKLPVGAGRRFTTSDYTSLSSKFGAFSDEQFVEFGIDVPKKEDSIGASMTSKDINPERMAKAGHQFMSRLGASAFQGFNKDILAAIQPASLTSVDAKQAENIPVAERKNISVEQIRQIGINCKGADNPIPALFTDKVVEELSSEQKSAVEERKKVEKESAMLMSTVSITLMVLFFGVVLL